MPLFSFTTSPPRCICDNTQFLLENPSVDLFDGKARSLAEELARPEVLKEEKNFGRAVWNVRGLDKANKPSQVRKFYDELCMWEQKCSSVESFEKALPFIKMLNAKAAYAKGRGLVDDKFAAWLEACLNQVSPGENGLNVLKNFRTHFEAFMGYYKAVRPEDN